MAHIYMEIEQKELLQIGDYTRIHIPECFPLVNTEQQINLVERIVRVEEELKPQLDLMKQGFETMKKCFA